MTVYDEYMRGKDGAPKDGGELEGEKQPEAEEKA